MSKQAFDRKLAEVGAFRHAPEPAASSGLRQALKDRNNYLVAKAAAIIAERRLADLAPDLTVAFQRFLRDPVKTDPQCWAKNALVKALKDLDYAEPDVFLQGIVHVQMEPAYLRPADTAVTLRGACALALTGCAMNAFDVLTRLTDLLCDPEMPARLDAARAIAHLSAREGALPLRLKVRLGDAEPEVIGQCLAALLSLNADDHLPFVGEFLKHQDPEIRIEASGVLAECREPEALSLLKAFFERQTDPELKRTLVTLLAASPQPAAAEYLLEILVTAPDKLASHVVEALARSRYSAACSPRAAAIMAERLR